MLTEAELPTQILKVTHQPEFKMQNDCYIYKT